MLDLLKKSAPSRIVNVASTFASDLDLDDLQFERRPFESFKAYAQSKACNRLLTWAFARRLDGSGVTINAMTPGLITETGLYRNAAPELVKRLNQYSGGRTSAQGADTAVWLASDAEVEGVTNKFFEDRKELPCEFRNEKNGGKTLEYLRRISQTDDATALEHITEYFLSNITHRVRSRVRDSIRVFQ